MSHLLAEAVVIGTGVYFIGLAALCLCRPQRARRFLQKFASSARAHVIEMLLRLLAGIGMVAYAPYMLFQTPVELFGWVLIISSAILLCIPWRWHQRFSQWAIPFAIGILPLFGSLSFVLGALILAAVFAR